MNRLPYRFHRIAAVTLALASAVGCSLINNKEISYEYEVDPQEFSEDASADLKGWSGTFPETDCSTDDAICSKIPNLPSSATTQCVQNTIPGTKHCIATYDVRLHQEIDLTAQKGFPAAVANSSIINLVTVDELRYWTLSNSLNVTTPPFDIYVGPQTATTETDASAKKIGSIGPIPAMMAPSLMPDCAKGPATSKGTACELQLSPEGKALLSTLAKSFKTPFNVIVVGHFTIHGGELVPAGKIQLYVQPVIGFHIPL